MWIADIIRGRKLTEKEDYARLIDEEKRGWLNRLIKGAGILFTLSFAFLTGMKAYDLCLWFGVCVEPAKPGPYDDLRVKFSKINSGRCSSFDLIVPFKTPGPTWRLARSVADELTNVLNPSRGRRIEFNLRFAGDLPLQGGRAEERVHDVAMFAAEYVSGLGHENDPRKHCTLLLHHNGLLFGLVQFGDLEFMSKGSEPQVKRFVDGNALKPLGRLNRVPMMLITHEASGMKSYEDVRERIRRDKVLEEMARDRKINAAALQKLKLRAGHAGVSSLARKCLGRLVEDVNGGMVGYPNIEQFKTTADAVKYLAERTPVRNGVPDPHGELIDIMCTQTIDRGILDYKTKLNLIKVYSDGVVDAFDHVPFELRAVLPAIHGLYAPPGIAWESAEVFEAAIKHIIPLVGKEFEDVGLEPLPQWRWGMKKHMEADKKELLDNFARQQKMPGLIPGRFCLYKTTSLVPIMPTGCKPNPPRGKRHAGFGK